ncbi:hypothetical protein [Pseudomonas sp. W5-01]|uniref:hypothetical protein n=1 Tax=Pseudomonas sp. W5-01 TaxID=3097454 RepID=UPI00397E7993
MADTIKFGTEVETVTQKITDFAPGTVNFAQDVMAEHIRRFGTTANGKSESFTSISLMPSQVQIGIYDTSPEPRGKHKQFWVMRLRKIPGRNRLPRGFTNAQLFV